MDPSTLLERDGIELRLATPRDALELFTALDHDSRWTHVADRPESEEGVVQTVIDATRRGRWMQVVRKHGGVVGTTSYLDVVPADERLEIGFTAYRPEDWATEVNPTCKLLLMEWAFSHGFGRVQFKTDARNRRSQSAIARLGAVREGLLRRYQRGQDSTIRETVMFSVVRDEWPGRAACGAARSATTLPSERGCSRGCRDGSHGHLHSAGRSLRAPRPTGVHP